MLPLPLGHAFRYNHNKLQAMKAEQDAKLLAQQQQAAEQQLAAATGHGKPHDEERAPLLGAQNGKL